MRLFFDSESRFSQTLSKAADLIILNLLWLGFSLPIITLGASTTALYGAIICMRTERSGSSILHDYLNAFTQNFKTATLFFVVLLIPVTIIFLNLWFLFSGRFGQSYWASIICFIPFFVVCFIFAYVFAYISLFRQSFLTTMKNVLVVSVLNFPKTILILVLDAAPVTLLMISPALFFRTFYIWLAGGVSLIVFLNTKLILSAFAPLLPIDMKTS